jgi:hypothetical protein
MVCGAMDHGGNRKRKIVERRQRREKESSNRGGVSRENKKFRNGSGIDGPSRR